MHSHNMNTSQCSLKKAIPGLTLVGISIAIYFASFWEFKPSITQETFHHSVKTDKGRFGSSRFNPETSQYDVCVVGAGLSGAVISERYAALKKTVLVLEKRDHIGGNCYDYIDEETGIRVNKYGAHLFHTKYKRVWEYVQQFSEWTPYEHRVLALVNGKHVPVPVNIDTINSLFNLNMTSSNEVDAWLLAEQWDYPNPKNSEEMALSRVGRRLYEILFKPYTLKQWGKSPGELGPEVMARIPVRDNRDNRYFGDPYQALPTAGYTEMFKRMFKRPGITLKLNTNYFSIRSKLKCGHTYFTGPIDAYFAHLGWKKLEYRSLDFERRVLKNTHYFQPISVVNHPSSETMFTRIVEYKHFLTQSSPDTVIFYEHSKDGGEPYYPVPNVENKELYVKYQKMAEQEPGVTFVGRLANYKYFNMDQSILNALVLFDKAAKELDGYWQDEPAPSLTYNTNQHRGSLQSDCQSQNVYLSRPASLQIAKKDGNFNVKNRDGNKNEHTAFMLKQVLSEVGDFCEIDVDTSGQPPCTYPGLAYATKKDPTCLSKAIPSNIFFTGPAENQNVFEVEAAHYFSLSSVPPSSPKTLGFSGNLSSSVHQILVPLGSRSKLIDLRNIVRKNGMGAIQDALPISEQIQKWEYLLDLGFNGISENLPFYLRSGRLLFYQERTLEQWFMPYFQGGVHYISIKNDLSDLEEKLEWANNNPEQRKQIVEACSKVALRVLNSQYALRILKFKVTQFLSLRISPISGPVPTRGCKPGNFETLEQYKSLFYTSGSNRFGLEGKALIVIPVGEKSAQRINTVVETLGTKWFHFLFFTYDTYDWSSMQWYHNVEWIKQPPHMGTCWSLVQHFIVPEKVKPYTHVCRWDDDLLPTEDFDGEVYLQWLQQLSLDISQLMIRQDAHAYEGLSVSDRPKNTQLHQVAVVENQLPCYSVKTYSECIWPNLKKNDSYGWGIDLVLHNRGHCIPKSIYSVRLPFDHDDGNTLDSIPFNNSIEYYTKLADDNHWPKRNSTYPLNNYMIRVDDSCRLSQVLASITKSSSAILNVPRLTLLLPAGGCLWFFLACRSTGGCMSRDFD